jgi:hypothetical protein
MMVSLEMSLLTGLVVPLEGTVMVELAESRPVKPLMLAVI